LPIKPIRGFLKTIIMRKMIITGNPVEMYEKFAEKSTFKLICRKINKYSLVVTVSIDKFSG